MSHVPKAARERAMRYLEWSGLRCQEQKYPAELTEAGRSGSRSRACWRTSEDDVMDEPFRAADAQTACDAGGAAGIWQAAGRRCVHHPRIRRGGHRAAPPGGRDARGPRSQVTGIVTCRSTGAPPPPTRRYGATTSRYEMIRGRVAKSLSACGTRNWLARRMWNTYGAYALGSPDLS